MRGANTSYEEANSLADDKAKLAKMEGNTSPLWARLWSSWSVAIYMVIFSAGIAVFWGLNLSAFYQTLDNYRPKLQVDSGFIGSNPGLGFRPMRLDSDPYSSL